MTSYSRGTTAVLSVNFRTYAPDGPLVDVNNIMIEIVPLLGGAPALPITNVGIIHSATGIYAYSWAIPSSLDTGDYVVIWTGNDIGTGDPVSATEQITVTYLHGTNSSYTPGTCAPYDFTLSCPLPTGAAAVTGDALDIATEMLYYATGQRFDACEITIRPCRKTCYDNWPAGWSQWGYTQPFVQPLLYRGLWYNIACGTCGENCSCTAISETVLPAFTQSITEVKVDGVVLVPGTDYRLDDYRKLVRLGGVFWPTCNDLTKDDTEAGTWSVTAVYGEPLPAMGKLAVGELLVEIATDMLCGSCQLPDSVTQLTRQGVSMTLDAATALTETDLYGLKWTDRFIRTYNPAGLRARSRMYDLDSPTFRITDT